MNDEELLKQVAKMYKEMIRAINNNEAKKAILMARLIDPKIEYLYTKFPSDKIYTTCVKEYY